MTISSEVKTRLLAKIKKDSVSGCWNWTASVDTHGYGHMRADGKVRLAHRLSYEAHRGPIPKGMQVCHHCDNRTCLNPSHLFIGTWRDNMMDKLSKNRQSRTRQCGETNPRSKLTEADVRAIRSATDKQQAIADQYGLHRAYISLIRSGKRWGHLK